MGEGSVHLDAVSEGYLRSPLSVLEANRTSRFLSGIINFIHFREACRDTYMEFLWQYVRWNGFWVTCQTSSLVHKLVICFESVSRVTECCGTKSVVLM